MSSSTEPKKTATRKWEIVYEMPGGGTRTMTVNAKTPEGAQRTVANLGAMVRETREVG